jgi:hypothetical protein
MLGIGPRLNTVFKSRWRAATWSQCILLTAYCTVPFADTARHHGTTKAASAQTHKSPWAY